MTNLDDAFNHPERMTDKQMEMMIAEQKEARNQRTGLAFAVTILSAITIIVTVAILAANGVFGG